jgi:hypothetical protein
MSTPAVFHPSPTFVRPDLIKLDMRLLQGRTTTEAAREPRRATRDLLVEMSMQLEQEGLDAAEPNIVVVTHDRDLVIRAAEPLLRRLVPER